MGSRADPGMSFDGTGLIVTDKLIAMVEHLDFIEQNP